MNSYLDAIKHTLDFSSRMGRRPFLIFHLVNLLITISLLFLAVMTAGVGDLLAKFFGLYQVGIILPSISVLIRRLHDTDRSGWYALLFLIPIIGFAFLIWLSVASGTDGENSFGEPHVIS